MYRPNPVIQIFFFIPQTPAANPHRVYVLLSEILSHLKAKVSMLLVDSAWLRNLHLFRFSSEKISRSPLPQIRQRTLRKRGHCNKLEVLAMPPSRT